MDATTLAELTEEINATEFTEADLAAARKFLERFHFTTTAVYALSVVLGEMDANREAEILRKASNEIAPIEAETV